MSGHFAVFYQWTEINSVLEGRFMERIARGGFPQDLSRVGRNAELRQQTNRHGTIE